MTEKIIAAGVLYLLSVTLGLWLSRRGRPLNPVLSAVHKLVSLGSVAVSALLVFGAPGLMQSGGLPAALGVASLASAATLIATGAILSGEKTNRALRTVHGTATALAILCLAAAVAL